MILWSHGSFAHLQCFIIIIEPRQLFLWFCIIIFDCQPHHQYHWEKTIVCFVMQIYNYQLSLDMVQVLVLRGNMLLDNNWSYTCPEYKIGNMILTIIIIIIVAAVIYDQMIIYISKNSNTRDSKSIKIIWCSWRWTWWSKSWSSCSPNIQISYSQRRVWHDRLTP